MVTKVALEVLAAHTACLVDTIKIWRIEPQPSVRWNTYLNTEGEEKLPGDNVPQGPAVNRPKSQIDQGLGSPWGMFASGRSNSNVTTP
jgi:hypothetical protein